MAVAKEKSTPKKTVKVPAAAIKAEKAETKTQQKFNPKPTGPAKPTGPTGSAVGAVAENIVLKDAVDFASEYGVQAALVNSTPELQALFNQAVAEKWTPAKFQAAFMNTTWYLNNSDTWRNAEATRLTDPASWREQLNLALDNVRKISAGLGFELDESQVSQLAEQSLYLAGGSASNVNLDQLKGRVVETGRLTGKGGTSLQAIDSLKTFAYNNGLSYSDGWYESAAKDILMGTGTINGWEKQIKDAAKSKYAALATQIDAGLNVRDIASPYIQIMSATLEEDQNTISLDDPLLQRTLTGIDEAGNPKLTPLWQFERDVKRDDRYFKTNKANQEFAAIATEVARQHGKAV